MEGHQEEMVDTQVKGGDNGQDVSARLRYSGPEI